MIKDQRKSNLWLLIVLLAVVLAACSPAAGTADPAGLAATATGVRETTTLSEPTEEVEEAPAGTPEDVAEPAVTEGPEAAVEVENEPAGNDADTAKAEAADSEEEVSSADSAEVAKAETAGNGQVILTDDSRTDVMKQITTDWNTDWKRHTIPYDELVPVLRRDGIRSLDEPTFQNLEEAAGWLTERDPVMVVALEGEARAYPLRILTAHEIVNDKIGDIPVVITYCPLCNSALVFDARFDGHELAFGTSGWLRNSDLVMYDRTTDSLWQQFTGEGIVGEYAGEVLTFLASSLVSFADFQAAFPEGQVLSNDTGFPFPYNLASYSGYDSSGSDPFLFFDAPDRRLPVMERVVSVSLDNTDIAYPVTDLAKVGVINDSQDGQDLVLFHSTGTTSAFFNPITNEFGDVGATGIFDPNLNGELLTFLLVGEEIQDEQTGSTWNVLGQATGGPLAGESLRPIVHGDHFWFSWAAFKPDTLIYGS